MPEPAPTVSLLVNLDVPDLAAAEAFYTAGLGLKPGRRLAGNILELLGAGVALYLIEKPAGSPAVPETASNAETALRDYQRHWTPVHLDFVVPHLDQALSQALDAGAVLERAPETQIWGRIAGCSDPFGHGFCLLEFLNRGYDEIVLLSRTPS